MNLRILSLIILTSAFAAYADDKKQAEERQEVIRSAVKEMEQGTALELKELEIRAKLYEPQIVYVLDRAKVDVDFLEEDVKFTPRNITPIEENSF